jgi:hypothetical protein
MRDVDNSTIPRVFVNLQGLSAYLRILAGAISIVIGSYITIYLWEGGFLLGLPIFLVVGGLCLFVPGCVDLKRELARSRELKEVLNREAEIAMKLVEAKRQGRNPYRALNEQNIRDPELRQLLLQKADQRLKSGLGSG